MKKLLSTPLALAVSAAFIIPVSLSSCSTSPKQEQTLTKQQELTPEEAARVADEKKKAAEKKRLREMNTPTRTSGNCGQ